MRMGKWVMALLLTACNLHNAAVPTATPPDQPSPTPEHVSPEPENRVTRSVDLLLTPNRPANGGSTPPGQSCAVYIVYSGVDPANVISMRISPSLESAQVYRIPNHARVYLLPGSQEVEAEGYRWLNIIYVDPAGQRYQGWAARDSFIQAGTRDPAIQTLRSTGEMQPC